MIFKQNELYFRDINHEIKKKNRLKKKQKKQSRKKEARKTELAVRIIVFRE